MRHLLTGLDTALANAAVPYGFTLTIWCTGAFLLSERSTPTPGQVFLFAGGGLVAFALLRIVTALVPTGSTPQIGKSPQTYLIVSAGEDKTVAVRRENIEEEERMATRIASSWDKFVEEALEEEGVIT